MTFLYLVEIRQIRNLVPQAVHDMLVFRQFGGIAFTFTLDDAGSQCHTLKIIGIQKSIVVNIYRRYTTYIRILNKHSENETLPFIYAIKLLQIDLVNEIINLMFAEH